MPLIKKASDGGYHEAQLMLGICYSYGEDVKQSDRKSLKLFKKAAKQGNEHAINFVAIHKLRKMF